MNEAETRIKNIDPLLKESGWSDSNNPDAPSFKREHYFTDGKIRGQRIRGKAKRADYLLYYRQPHFPLAVVEAKADYKLPSDGIQQAKTYAQMLGLSFAYSTNGSLFVEFDFITGLESTFYKIPQPSELWRRLKTHEGFTSQQEDLILSPFDLTGGKTPRYYQQIAINNVISAIVKDQKRILLTMATGNRQNDYCLPKSVGNFGSSVGISKETHVVLKFSTYPIEQSSVDDPMNKEFEAFGEARHRIEHGEVVKSRGIYFALYQSIGPRGNNLGIYREYAKDFFDLIIVDECHRGSAQDESLWRSVLEYFEPAVQLGMTATPLHEETRNTYLYFGNPVYAYSLKQGIEDGFLAPYRVRHVQTTADAQGWQPDSGQTDRHGNRIPDRLYNTEDFDKTLVSKAAYRGNCPRLN